MEAIGAPQNAPIFGIDFTSAPSGRKQIVCSQGQLNDNVLTMQTCLFLTSLEQFEAFLAQDGPWLAALDFPFGQPHRLLLQLGWPEAWEDYVWLIAQIGKRAFEQVLANYCEGKPIGDKLHLRATDIAAGARSPMMMQRVPVGKMFFEGASRLLAAPVSVLPCRPLLSNRIAVEGYPALIARRWIGSRSYKSDERRKQTAEQLAARRSLVQALTSDELATVYGMKVVIDDKMIGASIEDPMGDVLDAVLCALQAAWAYTQRDNGYGIPPGHEFEGWIADPQLRPI
ncbi:MAG TPA: DUF429 domain-containing protein [Ktedonosporobacter sp.]|jgi:hypothetical protein|nr:DUF429 domain-containing protein [Ktedonosporobacter sp.]